MELIRIGNAEEADLGGFNGPLVITSAEAPLHLGWAHRVMATSMVATCCSVVVHSKVAPVAPAKGRPPHQRQGLATKFAGTVRIGLGLGFGRQRVEGRPVVDHPAGESVAADGRGIGKDPGSERGAQLGQVGVERRPGRLPSPRADRPQGRVQLLTTTGRPGWSTK